MDPLLGTLAPILNTFYFFLKLFKNETLPRLMGSNNCFFNLIADVSFVALSHLNAPDQQSAKTSAFIKVLKLGISEVVFTLHAASVF